MILLDTHALIWWCDGDPRLSSDARHAIEHEQRDGTVAVSTFSCWEIAMLLAHQRLTLACELSVWLDIVASIACVRFIPVCRHIAVAAVELPGALHKDPADRLIVATARHLDAPLVTADRNIRAYGHVTSIW